MADDKQRLEDTVGRPPVAVQKGAQVGDDKLAPVHEVETELDDKNVPAMVMAKAPEPVREVYVHESRVKLDRVVTDPSSPEAVQIPDAGRGFLSLPLHGLDAPTPEQFFAAEASEVTDEDEGGSDEPKQQPGAPAPKA